MNAYAVPGGETVRTLMDEVQRLETENVRLKIAHLRRMADSCEGAKDRALEFAYPCPADGLTDDRYWSIIRRVDRFHAACLAKITELKELQCSTKF